jgi:sugar phosphate isomerase/epimerase
MAELCFNTFNRSAWHGVEPELAAQVAAAAEAGFPWFGPDRYSIDHWTAGGRSLEDLAALIADAGMGVWEISGLNVTDPAETRAEAEHLAAQAAVLRPRWILTNLGAPLDDEALATFDEACTILAGAGCRPAVEYLPFTPANSIAAATALVDHVGRDRAKVLFDTWHHFRGPDTWAELEAAPLDLVAYVQFDDARPVASDDLVDERVNRRAFPGEGEFDLARYCDVMRAKGFDGVVSVEVLENDFRARGDHAEFARRAFETSARFWPPARG